VSVDCVIWLDGEPTTNLPLPDRGLNFGDGLFETLLLKRGRPLFVEQHLQRLRLGLAVLALPDCLLTARRHLESAATAVGNKGWNWAVLRLTITRGAGPRGYAPPDQPTVRILVEASKLDRNCSQMSTPAGLCVAEIRLSSQPFLAGIKHLNRLEQVLAAAEGRAKGADECVVLDQYEHVISVVAGNLFVVRGGELVTPKLIECGVEGTRRRLIIDNWGPSIGLEVREATLGLTDLDDAEEVFYSNSLLGVRPVATLGERSWDSHRVCSALFQRILEEVT